MVDDQADGLEEHSVLGIGVLHLLGLGRLLGFVENRLQALGQAATHCRVFWAKQPAIGGSPQPALPQPREPSPQPLRR